ncbi:MAG TPA: MarR family winged helix-turn-helix transcriptional regulator [Rhizomicrobium sp.]|nr:MarR family winged helix-turn-helix transcriptional regulator [Rhizomicrobium sp.]
MHRKHDIDAIAAALMELTGLLNSPGRDEVLMAEAGVALPRALFPLLVRIGAAGAAAVTALADQAGRDHSTISRQVAQLEALGFVRRRIRPRDARVNEVAITAAGRQAVARVTAARRRLLGPLLSDWSPAERRELARLNLKLAAAIRTA